MPPKILTLTVSVTTWKSTGDLTSLERYFVRSLPGLAFLGVGITNLLLGVLSRSDCGFTDPRVTQMFTFYYRTNIASIAILVGLAFTFLWWKLQLPKKVIAIANATRNSKLDLE